MQQPEFVNAGENNPESTLDKNQYCSVQKVFFSYSNIKQAFCISVKFVIFVIHFCREVESKFGIKIRKIN